MAHPVHATSTHQHNPPEGCVFWKKEGIPGFVLQLRKGNEYLLLWLCGFVARSRISSFVRGLQNLLSGGLAGNASGNAGNVSGAEEGDLRLFQPANSNVAPSAQGSIQAAACFVSRNPEPPYFFHLINRTAARRMLMRGSPQKPVQPRVRQRHRSSAQRLVNHSDKLRAASSRDCLVPHSNGAFVWGRAALLVSCSPSRD